MISFLISGNSESVFEDLESNHESSYLGKVCVYSMTFCLRSALLCLPIIDDPDTAQISENLSNVTTVCKSLRNSPIVTRMQQKQWGRCNGVTKSKNI